MEEKSRALAVGCGVASYDLASFNLAITGGHKETVKQFISATAFENLTDTEFYVAVVTHSLYALKTGIHVVPSLGILPMGGSVAYNLGASLTDSYGTLTDNRYAIDSKPAAGEHFVVCVYATEGFYLDLTNCVVVNNDAYANASATNLIPAGQHTIMFKAIENDATAIAFLPAGDATPSGLAVTGHAITAWTQNQCKALI
jgi:hypothetical protein